MALSPEAEERARAQVEALERLRRRRPRRRARRVYPRRGVKRVPKRNASRVGEQ